LLASRKVALDVRGSAGIRTNIDRLVRVHAPGSATRLSVLELRSSVGADTTRVLWQTLPGAVVDASPT
jgi:hypothetical protein